MIRPRFVSTFDYNIFSVKMIVFARCFFGNCGIIKPWKRQFCCFLKKSALPRLIGCSEFFLLWEKRCLSQAPYSFSIGYWMGARGNSFSLLQLPPPLLTVCSKQAFSALDLIWPALFLCTPIRPSFLRRGWAITSPFRVGTHRQPPLPSLPEHCAFAERYGAP